MPYPPQKWSTSQIQIVLIKLCYIMFYPNYTNHISYHVTCYSNYIMSNVAK